MPTNIIFSKLKRSLRSYNSIVLVAAAFTQTLQAATCKVEAAAAGLEFGNYQVSSGAHNEDTAVITITCTASTIETVNYTILLGAGIGSTGNANPFLPREMQLNTQINFELNYNAYTTISRTQVWKEVDTDVFGNTVSGTMVFLSPGMQSNSHVIYGRIPALQEVPSGEYYDTLEVTLEY